MLYATVTLLSSSLRTPLTALHFHGDGCYQFGRQLTDCRATGSSFATCLSWASFSSPLSTTTVLHLPRLGELVIAQNPVLLSAFPVFPGSPFSKNASKTYFVVIRVKDLYFELWEAHQKVIDNSPLCFDQWALPVVMACLWRRRPTPWLNCFHSPTANP